MILQTISQSNDTEARYEITEKLADDPLRLRRCFGVCPKGGRATAGLWVIRLSGHEFLQGAKRDFLLPPRYPGHKRKRPTRRIAGTGFEPVTFGL